MCQLRFKMAAAYIGDSRCKGVDNMGARGAFAPPDFQCVNTYKALIKHLEKK